MAAARVSAHRAVQTPAGGLLLVYISGHGGQVRDTSGDEADGMDETLCLWDGALNDDVLRSVWESLPTTIRVAYITDTCNSGTNYRDGPHDIARSIPRGFAGQLIHIGGCADGLSSFGSHQGGHFTTAMVDAWNYDQSWVQWFAGIKRTIKGGQVPVYAEYGPVTDAFRHGRALR